MDTVLLLITAGLCAVSSHAERQYHFVYDPKNWTEAQSYCREKYTDLATVDNMEDVNTLNNMTDTSRYEEVWIGLHKEMAPSSWKWSLSDTSFYKYGGAEFRRLSHGETDNAHGNEYCTFIRYDGVWKAIRCNSSLFSICSYVRGSDVTFILITKSMTWTEAQSHCRVNYTDLTSVRNMTENQKVQELIPAGERVWIGLFRDSWKWSDGSSSSFRHWRPGQPDNHVGNEDCAAAHFGYSGQWHDLPCDHRKAFICYSTSMTKQVLRLKFHTQDSSLDLNDPAVMEDTLKKLKQKLEDQGLGDNIKLSWRKQPDGKVFHKEEKKKKKKKTRNDEL